MIMRKLSLLLAFLFLLGWFIWWSTPPVRAASSQPQVVYQTPTPGPDGRIIYIVKEKDTCLSISLLNQIDVNQLRALNRLDDQCVLLVGQKLLLGVISESSPTPGPSPTPQPTVPTPTPFNGNANICIYLFEDKNGNGIPDGDETQIPGGAVSMTDRTGKNSFTGTTPGGADPLCFGEVPEGDYNISVAPPEGMNPTTNMNYPLEVKAGDQSTLDFGAQRSNIRPVEPTSTPLFPSRSPVLGILGGILILGGLGLGAYFWWMRR